MKIRLAKRLDSLEGKKLAFLDCGKRGSEPILQGIEKKLRRSGDFTAAALKKPNAHSCASRKLIEQLASTCDAIVYGVVN
jgi:hypothetical protein